MSARPLKRARTSGQRVSRPIDKELIAITKVNVANTQVETVLKTVTFPGTVVGLRWALAGIQDAGTGAPSFLQWCVVVVQDGNAASTMVTTDAADMYTPEQDVLAFGNGLTKVGIEGVTWEGTTKTMRKMKQGDQLLFIAVAEVTHTWELRGTIQFFFKT